MKSELCNSFYVLFLMGRYFGLTAYSFRKHETDHRKLFKRNLKSQVLSIIMLTLLLVGSAQFSSCHNRFDEFGFISSQISRILRFAYFVILKVTVYCKQTTITKIFIKILQLEEMVAQLTQKQVDATFTHKSLKFLVLVQCVNISVLVGLNMCLMQRAGVRLGICVLKFVGLSLVQLVAEGLLFYFLIASSEIMSTFNHKIKDIGHISLSIRGLRKIYQRYFEIKSDVENVCGLFTFVKILHVVSEIATTIYSFQKDVFLSYYSENQLSVVFILNVYWAFHTVFQIIVSVYPVIVFLRAASHTLDVFQNIQFISHLGYKEVILIRSTFNTTILADCGLQKEMFLLQAEMTEKPFTAHGFVKLDWSLFFLVMASVATHLLYLVQFKNGA